MTNPLHKAIYDKVVAPTLSKRKHNVKGTILAYDHINNRACVEWKEDGITKTKFGVPVQLTGGVVAAGPFIGDAVWIEFTNGNITAPKVVAIADYYYEENTRENRTKHKRKGAYCPDALDYL